ncbi:hypothetical protein PG985_014173 [Apiospora marii]|uniref:LRAT domain-containing protein n=1 Tax=Apiospora marii TaxID=335849 RepID=A0ABR1R5P9_9PEZI
MEEPALSGEKVEVYLVRLMLSKSAGSYHSWLGGPFVSWLQKLDITNPMVWMSHHALKIHGDYYELCRDVSVSAPFMGTAQFKLPTADSNREFENRQKWAEDDILLGATILTRHGIDERIKEHEQNLTTPCLKYYNSLLKPRHYSLLNSNCQHFVLDLGFCLQVEFDEHGLAEVWRGTTIVRKILNPIVSLIGLMLTTLAFAAETKWTKALSYTCLVCYFILFRTILIQDLFRITDREERLQALHFYDIDQRSSYLCRQFRKLQSRVRPTQNVFYRPQDTNRFGADLWFWGLPLLFYIYRESYPLTIGSSILLFLKFTLMKIIIDNVIIFILDRFHPLRKGRLSIYRQNARLTLALMRNWRMLHGHDFIHTIRGEQSPSIALERTVMQIEQTQLGNGDEEQGLLRNGGEGPRRVRREGQPHAILWALVREMFTSSDHECCRQRMCGPKCILGQETKQEAKKWWQKRDTPIEDDTEGHSCVEAYGLPRCCC